MLRRPIAHRGLHDPTQRIAENSSSAFAAAIARDYAIECDVQMSADGEAMVFHDQTLDRVMDAAGIIRNHTVRHLQSLTYRLGRDRMQTLGDLLLQVRSTVPIFVEIKPHWDGAMSLAERVCEIVSAYQGPLALMSFDPEIVAHLAKIAPHVTRGVVADRVHAPYYAGLSIVQRNHLRSLAHLAATKPHFISYDTNGLPFAPIQQIRARGFPVITWTITSALAASRARRYSDQITFEGFLPN